MALDDSKDQVETKMEESLKVQSEELAPHAVRHLTRYQQVSQRVLKRYDSLKNVAKDYINVQSFSLFRVDSLSQQKLVLTDDAVKLLSNISVPIYPVAIIGQARSGKSAMLDALVTCLVEDVNKDTVDPNTPVFVSAPSEETVTYGIDFTLLKRKNPEAMYLFLDCEGITIDNSSPLSSALSALCMGMCKVLFVNTKDETSYLKQLLLKMFAMPCEKESSVLFCTSRSSLRIEKFGDLWKEEEMKEIAERLVIRKMVKTNVAVDVDEDDYPANKTKEYNEAVRKQLRQSLCKKLRGKNVIHDFLSVAESLKMDGNDEMRGEELLGLMKVLADKFNDGGSWVYTRDETVLFFKQRCYISFQIALQAYKASMRWVSRERLPIPDAKLADVHCYNMAKAEEEFLNRTVRIIKDVRDEQCDKLLQTIKDYYQESIVRVNKVKVVKLPNKIASCGGETYVYCNLGSTMVAQSVVVNGTENGLKHLTMNYIPSMGGTNGHHAEAEKCITKDNREGLTSDSLRNNMFKKENFSIGTPDSFRNASNKTMVISFGEIMVQGKVAHLKFERYDDKEAFEYTANNTESFEVTDTDGSKFDFSLQAEQSAEIPVKGATLGSKITEGLGFGISKQHSNKTASQYSSGWSLRGTAMTHFGGKVELELKVKRYCHVVAKWGEDVKTTKLYGNCSILVPKADIPV